MLKDGMSKEEQKMSNTQVKMKVGVHVTVVYRVPNFFGLIINCIYEFLSVLLRPS